MKKEHFEAFLSSNEKRIYNYVLSLCTNEQDALDIVQTVFIAVFQNLERIEETTALAYTYKIAHNKCLSFLKQKSRYINVEPDKFNGLPERNTNTKEPDYTVLKKAIADLPPRLSAVIQMQYYEKMSYKEISTNLGISVKAVESLLVRAKRILRKKILQDKEK
ncbi:MAG: RNA polymerase sigma factor [Candidatus Cloacimonas sp.]